MEGQIWHINCLRCVVPECKKKLSGANWGGFVPPDNEPYCSVHFKRLIQQSGSAISISGSAGTKKWTPKEKDPNSPSTPSRFGGAPKTKCTKCEKTVYNAEMVKMDGQIWHQNCLRCVVPECKKKLSGANWGGFVPPDNEPYCKTHHGRLLQAAGSAVGFSGSAGTTKWTPKEKDANSPSTPSRFGGAPKAKCTKCGKSVYNAEMVKMDGQIWHQNCLRCVVPECKKKLSGANWGGFVPPDNEPYCKTHHARLLQAAGSAVGFSGSAGTKKWTPKEKDPNSPATPSKSRWGGAPSTKCEKCGKTVYNAEMTKMENRIFHSKCLRCIECKKILSGANWGGFTSGTDAYCKIHLDRMIAATGSAVGLSGGRDAKWKVET
eukprot:TRINITY_DN120_c0_g1_i1.p1 TRINITY_DN120_c0_g1~~TRINITY_DN120_c0_g1_i1.p1  ORF type:complete len:436 (+),score=73.37 TRINITY_DN120_c0_g1_i1:180-1310(+)